MEVFWSLAVAWAEQKWPKMWKLARNGRDDKDGHTLSQLPFSESRLITSIASLKELSELGKRDSASLTGFVLIFTHNTDKTRYVVQQLKSEV